ncbi:RNA-binding protein [Yarrowia sp. B02]|nr:RNA-binding protein [Yarrowia sp. B02]
MSSDVPQIPPEQVSTSLPLDSPNGADGRDSGFSSGVSSGKDPSTSSGTSSGTNSGSNCETSSGSGSGSNSANEGELKADTPKQAKKGAATAPSVKRTLSDTLPKQVETVAPRSGSNSKYRKLDEMFSNEEAKWNGETPPISSSNTPSDKFFSPPASDKTTNGSSSRDTRRRYRSKSPQRKPDAHRDGNRSSREEPQNQRRHNRNSYYPDYSRDERDSRDSRDSRDFDWKSRPHDRDSRNSNGWERYRPDWVQEWDTYRNRDNERARERYRRWETEHERNYERRGPAAKDPELSAEDRDKRTVYVQQVAPHVQSTELFDFFAEAGPVHDVSLVKDRSSRCRGVAFVEFEDVESVPRAIGLTGRSLHGQALLVRCTDSVRTREEQAEPSPSANPPSSAASAASGGTPSASAIDSVRFHRLYVGNIYFGVTEGEIIQIFEAFGPIEFADLQKEKTGKSKGYCFIQYVNPDDAKTALEKMNGFELAGRKLRVGLGLGERGATKARKILTEIGLLAADGVSRSADQVATQIAVDRQNQKLKLKDQRNQQREEEHQRASHTSGETVEFTSKCAILRNMFDFNEESGNWVEELKEDVRLECEEKFGPLATISLEVEKGEILLRFRAEQDCVKAVNNLHQRYFGGRVINASHISEDDFDKKLPPSQSPPTNLEEVAEGA